MIRRNPYKFTENPYYCPCMDECWVNLAMRIMEAISDSYEVQLPTLAFDQKEYDLQDARKYAPARRSLLRCVKYGPIRHIAKIDAIYSGMERRRLKYKHSLGIQFSENHPVDINTL